MSDGESVTRWIHRIKTSDDEDAAARLWTRYHGDLVRLAERALGNTRVVDGEDVALDVLHTLIRGARNGRFEQLTDRDDLWCLLIAITKHKAVDVVRRETAEKRGGGRVRGESVFEPLDGEGLHVGLASLVGDSPTPEELVSLEEERERLLALLDDELRKIAELRIAGHTVDEIAERVVRTPGAIERKLARIRARLARELRA